MGIFKLCFFLAVCLALMPPYAASPSEIMTDVSTSHEGREMSPNEITDAVSAMKVLGTDHYGDLVFKKKAAGFTVEYVLRADQTIETRHYSKDVTDTFEFIDGGGDGLDVTSRRIRLDMWHPGMYLRFFEVAFDPEFANNLYSLLAEHLILQAKVELANRECEKFACGKK
jgi:hypothetical protein